jgi:anti-sigma regulatory factor (Ser/Thr protein kinase)
MKNIIGQRLNGSSNGNGLSLQFASAPDAASAARQALTSLEGKLDRSLLDDVRLLATELITNSVRHSSNASASPVGFEVTITASTVRIEVSDAGDGFKSAEPQPRADGAAGWGLYLVDRIADRWGVVKEAGTRVWFEIDRVRTRTAAAAA